MPMPAHARHCWFVPGKPPADASHAATNTNTRTSADGAAKGGGARHETLVGLDLGAIAKALPALLGAHDWRVLASGKRVRAMTAAQARTRRIERVRLLLIDLPQTTATGAADDAEGAGAVAAATAAGGMGDGVLFVRTEPSRRLPEVPQSPRRAGSRQLGFGSASSCSNLPE